MRSGKRKNQPCMRQTETGLYCTRHRSAYNQMSSGVQLNKTLLPVDDNGFQNLLGSLKETSFGSVRIHTENGGSSSGHGSSGSHGSHASSGYETLPESSRNTTGSESSTTSDVSRLFSEALIMGDPIAVAKDLLKKLNLSAVNRRVILKKIQYASTLRTSSSEYTKTMTWLKHALSFPWNTTTDSPVLLPRAPTTQDDHGWSELVLDGADMGPVRAYISKVHEALNSSIYGLDKVKEELMAYVCKRITNPNATDHVLALQGPNGVGKCLGPNVHVRMYDGSSVPVQNVRTGDKLMGDNMEPRFVLSTTSGMDSMYRVVHSNTGQTFTCNGEHILCLRYITLPTMTRLVHEDKRTGVTYSTLRIRHWDPEKAQLISRTFAAEQEDTATEYLNDLIDTVWKVPVNTYLAMNDSNRKKFAGYAIPVDYPFTHVSVNVYLVGRWLGCAAQSPRSARALADTVCGNQMDTRAFLAYLRNQNLFRRKRVPSELMANSMRVREQLLHGIRDAWHVRQRKKSESDEASANNLSTLPEVETMMMTIRSRELAYDLQNLLTSMGIVSRISPQSHRLGPRWRLVVRNWSRQDRIMSPVKVTSIGVGPYHGFTLDGNSRFLLASHVVTHNTRIAHCLSQALNVPFRGISLGTVADVSYFTGHGYTFHESEPGRIVQILQETQSRNSIIYFDELDKVHTTEKGQAIQSFLTHLIDPSQNTSFHDTYLNGLDLDVSQVLFVFSFNDENLLDRTVKDRLKIIRIKEPSFDDKLEIARRFLLPEVCRNIGFDVSLSQPVLASVVRSQQHTSGLRSIKRLIEDIVSKLNVVRLLEGPHRQALSFYRSDYAEMISAIIKEFDERHEDPSALSMYS